MKTCSKCKKSLPKAAFYRRKASPDGLAYICKDCDRIRLERYREHCPNRCKEYRDAHYRTHRAIYISRAKSWSEENRMQRKKISREWAARNLEYGLANLAKRRAAKDLRTPAWANLPKIRAFYLAAKAFDYFNPCAKHHVDHIVPLRGERVSGLHTEANLQILTELENLQKGNTFSC